MTTAAKRYDNNPAATFKQDDGWFNAVEGTDSHTGKQHFIILAHA